MTCAGQIDALEDYYSPPHHMRVMQWSQFDNHLAAEGWLDIQSGPARQAAAMTKEYASLFAWLGRLGGAISMSRETMRDVAWGMFGQMLFIDAETSE